MRYPQPEVGSSMRKLAKCPGRKSAQIIHEQLVVTVVMQAFGFVTGMCFRRITNSSAGNMKRVRQKKEDEYFQVFELLTPNFSRDQLR